MASHNRFPSPQNIRRAAETAQSAYETYRRIDTPQNRALGRDAISAVNSAYGAVREQGFANAARRGADVAQQIGGDVVRNQEVRDRAKVFAKRAGGVMLESTGIRNPDGSFSPIGAARFGANLVVAPHATLAKEGADAFHAMRQDEQLLQSGKGFARAVGGAAAESWRSRGTGNAMYGSAPAEASYNSFAGSSAPGAVSPNSFGPPSSNYMPQSSFNAAPYQFGPPQAPQMPPQPGYGRYNAPPAPSFAPPNPNNVSFQPGYGAQMPPQRFNGPPPSYGNAAPTFNSAPSAPSYNPGAMPPRTPSWVNQAQQAPRMPAYDAAAPSSFGAMPSYNSAPSSPYNAGPASPGNGSFAASPGGRY